MKRVLSLQRLALPLVFAQIAATANGYITSWFLAKSSAVSLHAALPGSMLAAALSTIAVATLSYSGTIFARRHGEGREADARAVFFAALVLAAAAIPLFAAAVPFGRRILALFNTSPEVYAAEATYFSILVANGYFTALAGVLGGYFTGQGRTRFVGAVSACGCVANALLAPVFIRGIPPLPFSGIAGAGCATVAANVLVCVTLAAAILLRLAKAPRRAPSHGDFTEILRLGLPSGIHSFIDIGGFFVFTALLAECSPAAAVASSAAFAVNGVFQVLPWGLSRGTEIMSARSEESARKEVLHAALLLSAAYSVLFAVVLALAGRWIIMGFRAEDAPFSAGEFWATARILLVILAAKSFFESATSNMQAFLRGRGETAAVLRIQLCASCLFWMPLYFAVRLVSPSIPAYWLTMTACSVLTCALLYRRARRPHSSRHGISSPPAPSNLIGSQM